MPFALRPRRSLCNAAAVLVAFRSYGCVVRRARSTIIGHEAAHLTRLPSARRRNTTDKNIVTFSFGLRAVKSLVVQLDGVATMLCAQLVRRLAAPVLINEAWEQHHTMLW